MASIPRPSTSCSSDFDPPEPATPERIDLACAAWKKPGNTTSINKLARQHHIWPSTLQKRITNGTSKKEDGHRRQRLTPEEETALVNYICRLQTWGWPGQVDHIKAMAQSLCQAKGDSKPLGIHWPQKFLGRHPDIKTKYVPPLDKERAMAQDPEILSDWFKLFQQNKQKYAIADEDIYNMDEKGFMQGVVGKVKVMISRHEKRQYMTQPGNREWVSTIEAISGRGKLLRPFIIFKAVYHQIAWTHAFPEATIACTLNGWTDNEIGLAWLQHFAEETAVERQGQYRLLIFDGHASHVSTAAVDFCLRNDIILLCLPPHSTHVLQPLDIGLFAPLATAYKANIRSITRLGASYSIDKVDFLEQYQKARTSAFTFSNIQKAWEKAGLLPYNPGLILDHFSVPLAPPKSQAEHYSVTIPSATPAKGTLNYSGPNGSSSRLLTPKTTLQVQQILKRVHEGDDLEEIAKKCGKAASLALAEVTIQERTNADLMALQQRKENKANRPKGNYGNAKILDQNELRRQLAKEAWNKEWDRLQVLKPTIFEESQAAARRRQIALASPQKTQPRAKITTSKQPEQAPLRVPRLVVRLPIRVTTQELNHGRWTLRMGVRTLDEQKVADRLDGIPPMGRGHRVRKPRRAA